MTAPAGYPGLEILARQAFDRARNGTPPDVGIAILFAFHYGPAGEGGLAWVAGTSRDDAIGCVVEWLRHQVTEGRREAVSAALKRWGFVGLE